MTLLQQMEQEMLRRYADDAVPGLKRWVRMMKIVYTLIALATLHVAHAASFYMATTGSDSNACTLAAPCATPQRLQAVMRTAGGTNTAYVRGGTYNLGTQSNCGGGSTTCLLDLTNRDNRETWSYYGVDGIDSAVWDGGCNGSNGSTCVNVLVRVDGTSHVTINGLKLLHFNRAAISTSGGTSHFTAENNEAAHGYSTSNGPAGLLAAFGCNNCTLHNNYIHDIAGFGINNVHANGNITNFTVTENFIQDTCTGISDCGGIYVQDLTGTDTGILINKNYLRDTNTLAAVGSGSGVGIYLDDCTSNVVADNNVIAGHFGSQAYLIHGGSNVALQSSLIDLADKNASTAAWQTSDGCTGGFDGSDMMNTEFISSVVIGNGGQPAGGFPVLSGTPAHSPFITGNLYYSYGATAISTSAAGGYSDSNPVTGADPLISGWPYSFDDNSPAYDGPTGYDGNGPDGDSGPDGFSNPMTGTVPSSPH